MPPSRLAVSTPQAIVTIAVVMILGAIRVNVAPIIASAGNVGLAIGFGAQSLVSDNSCPGC